MKIMINASNLGGAGGAAQVADSICRELYKYPQHQFVVVLSASFSKTKDAIKGYDNTKVIEYSYPTKDWHSLLTKRNSFLDGLVYSEKVDRVLTVFGPTKWVPRCKHLCGFAYAHIVMPDSPYFTRMSIKSRLKSMLSNKYMEYQFRRCSKVFYSENSMISNLLAKKWTNKKIYTVTNNFNQVFDHPEQWGKYALPAFDGIRIFTASAMMPHKNLPITVGIAQYLKEKYPSFKFQFVLTVDENQFVFVPDYLRDCFYYTGAQHISVMPTLYNQCDIVFQPTLLECFTASYAEAMKMQKPLVVPDLPFSKGLCGDAASYYPALSADMAAERIYQIVKDEDLRKKLVENGKRQLLYFDTNSMRVEKLVGLCEEL